MEAFPQRSDLGPEGAPKMASPTDAPTETYFELSH